jgi:hypothetical protein
MVDTPRATPAKPRINSPMEMSHSHAEFWLTVVYNTIDALKPMAAHTRPPISQVDRSIPITEAGMLEA